MPKIMMINGKAFNKTECTEHFRKMLNKYKIGDKLNHQDYLDLNSLLAYHNESGDKIGCGVSSFRVVTETVYGHRRFEIIRNDDSTCDFSYIKCITPAKTVKDDHYQEVMKAMRYEVFGQIVDFKNKAYGNKKYVRCAITQLNVRKKDCHIDHAPPTTFMALVFDFLKSKGLSVDDVKVKDADSVGLFSIRNMSDLELRNDWQEYHKNNAVLRVTLDHANLGQKKSQIDFSELENLDCTNEEIAVQSEDEQIRPTRNHKAIELSQGVRC